MNFKRNKYVRFKNWSSDRSSTSEQQFPIDHGAYEIKSKLSLSSSMEPIRRKFETWSQRFRSLRNSSNFKSPSVQIKKKSTSGKKIFDPQESFIQQWNKIFVLSCFIAVSVDPLFFYIPVLDQAEKCLDLDKGIQTSACILRSLTDFFYILHIIFQFRTGYIAPSSRVFGRGELIEDSYAIAKRYLSSYFIIDILSVLPLPQVVILIIIPILDGPMSWITKDILKYIILIQYIPRTIRIIPLLKEVARTSGLFTETAWAGAAFNLFLFMLAGHAAGAFWYLFSIEQEENCWRIAFGRNNCDFEYLDCGQGRSGNYSFLNSSCQLLESNQIKNSTDFDFGIYLDALRSQIVETKVFSRKFLYCFWWGLRNLSSLGQNLKTSTSVGETLFAISISIGGLVLFSFLIGNMQKYLQSITVRLEEMRVKRRDTEQWMSHRMLPDSLRERIRRYEQYKWLENRGVEEEALIYNLPKDLRRDIKRHLCWGLLKRVPMFETMDDQLLDAMCDRLKTVLYTEKSFVVGEGDPVDEMLFVMRGNMLTMTTNGGKTGFFNSVYLSAGDFCGEELLTWALDPNSSSSLPTSTRTVQAVTDVEAFALVADDLKFVASQFRRLHSKQIQHTFRFCSQQWRTWAVCLIQAAWHRHCRRKLEKTLREEEDKLQDALAKEAGMSPSLAATMYASKFAANVLGTSKHNQGKNTKVPQKLPPQLIQKPEEPDFTAEGR